MRGHVQRYIAGLCLCMLAAVVCIADAATPAPIPIPEATSLLVDQAGALTETEHDALLGRLQGFQEAGRAQIAIFIAEGSGGEPLAGYSLRVAEAWQLGRAARDDGLLILIIPSPAAARLEVGYGLEGYIPDARAAQWLDELVPTVKRKAIASGLDVLLDRIDGALPKPAAKETSGDSNYLFPDHPEWRLPFVLVVFSLFAIFPMFMGRRGSFLSAPLLAAFLGGAALALWGATAATFAVAGIAFLLPLAWGLNASDAALPRWLVYCKVLGNLAAVAMFFSIITLFVGTVLWFEARELVLAAPIFAGMLAMGLAVFLFPGKPADYLMAVLRSACHFVFMLVVAYLALHPFVPYPGAVATGAAAIVTTLAAIGLYLDSRERGRLAAKWAGLRASQWLFMAALLVTLPLGLIALILAVGGEDLQTRVAQAAAGGGSIAGVLGLAARYGLLAAVKIGLGGRFGGGGAGRSD